MALSHTRFTQGYNNCPAETEQLLCMWDEKSQSPRFFWSYVCGFGNAASVVSFCRLPELVSRFTARLFATFTRAYIDDYLQPDFKIANNSSQEVLAFIHHAIGVPLAACLHESCANCNKSPKDLVTGNLPKCKRRRFHHTQEELGVIINMKNAHKGFIDFCPKPGRCERILADLDACQSRGLLPPHEAEEILGRLGFVTHSSIFGGVARAPTLPFYRRAYKRSLDGLSADLSTCWTTKMDQALEFLHAILHKDRLPHRRVFFNDQPPALGYSDAQGETYGIGLVTFDPFDLQIGIPGRFSATIIPAWLLERLRLIHPRDDDQGIIACVELVGAISLLLTYPDNFAHRRAFLFQDNSCAFAAMVSGRSSSISLNEVANIYHLIAAALGIDVWVEWCASEAMIADMPSRLDSAHKHHEKFKSLKLAEREAVFPTPKEWDDPISFYFSLRRKFGSKLIS